MSKYWVYIDDKVEGPYTVDQVIRLRGFSRQTRICAQEGEEGPQSWTSPANIPELSHIFKAVEETRPVMLPPRPKPKPVAPKQRPRPAAEVPSASPTRHPARFQWGWVVAAVVAFALAGAGFLTWQQMTIKRLAKERALAQKLVENVPVATASGSIPFSQYMAQKNIQPRWEYERQPTDLYNVSVIWFENGANGVSTSAIHAFEVNLEAQTVRPLNSKAAKLMSEGVGGASKTPAETPAKPKMPDFQDTLSEWQSAVQSGDFETVWAEFSDRKVRDMQKGGISHSGFVRLQALTHKVEADTAIHVMKVKSEGTDSRLVLLKQTQKGRPDIFIRQYWMLENGAWKLDDEQKKAAPAADASPAPEAKPAVTSLPGISH
jgi:hypothetical protein